MDKQVIQRLGQIMDKNIAYRKEYQRTKLFTSLLCVDPDAGKNYIQLLLWLLVQLYLLSLIVSNVQLPVFLSLFLHGETENDKTHGENNRVVDSGFYFYTSFYDYAIVYTLKIFEVIKNFQIL